MPTSDFEWGRVNWRMPRLAPPRRCSYCTGEMFPDQSKLILVDMRGREAQFCRVCMQKYWCPEPTPHSLFRS